jgi:hypothetical protein
LGKDGPGAATDGLRRTKLPVFPAGLSRVAKTLKSLQTPERFAHPSSCFKVTSPQEGLEASKRCKLQEKLSGDPF